jgi:hypothetical protein
LGTELKEQGYLKTRSLHATNAKHGQSGASQSDGQKAVTNSYIHIGHFAAKTTAQKSMAFFKKTCLALQFIHSH